MARARKLMLVRNSEKAKQMRQALGKEWSVEKAGCRLHLWWDIIVLVDQPAEHWGTPEKYNSFIQDARRRLTRDGQLIELY